MKLPQLLSQFLYQTRKLDLPGIGSFTLDPTAVIPQEADRVGQMPATGIQFKNANILAPDDVLINFIKEHTGKMKSLASSDLDFFLTTGRQLLNIGKPFYIEGIGTLVKTKDKGLEFTHGEYMIARLEDSSPERRVSYDEPAKDREQPRNNSNRQIMLLALIVLGLVVLGWGAYYLYRRNNFTEPSTEKQAVVIPDTTARTDSNAASIHPATDTAAAALKAAGQPKATVAATTPATTPATNPPAINPPPVNPGSNPGKAAVDNAPIPAGATLYHFVILETANKYRALRRYNQLLGYQLNIKMDQKDSAWFKLYFPIAATVRDTTHIKDSLADVYAAPRVMIEH